MGKRGDNKQRERAKLVSFKRRKASIMKKTMELSVLCDLQACAVVIEDNGQVTTWPENQCEVMKVLERYRACCCGADNGKVKAAVPAVLDDDPMEWDEVMLDNLLKEPLQELLNVGFGGDDDIMDDHQRLLAEVDAKLQAVIERIEFLKSSREYGSIQNPPCLLDCDPVESSIQMVPIMPASSDTNQMPCFYEYSLNQQSNLYFQAIPGPSEAKSEVETIPDPCFFEYFSDQQGLLDIAATIPVSVAEQGFPETLPQFLGDNSEQMMFHVIPNSKLGYSREISEQFNPQLNSMNWSYDFYCLNGY